jgi:23S rRNA pseudouridine955/2504/2580 synthase
MSMRTLIVGMADAGKTFEQFVAKRLPAVQKPLYYQYLRKKCFKINGVHVSTGKEIVHENDTLAFYVEDRYLDGSPSKPETKIGIVFEDEKILVADKPEGLLSHLDEKLPAEEDLLTVLSRQKKVLPGTYSLVNRLDFNTSGLIIVGKDPVSTRELNNAAMKDQIRKFYRCLAVGYLPKTADELHAWLLKDEPSALVRISETFLPKATEIITRYTVLQEGNGLSLLEIELLTGKTHQIRAHLASIDHPVLGDPLYGNEKTNKKYGVEKQALWASKIVFAIPDSSSPLYDLNGKTIVKDEPEWLRFLSK